MNNINKNNKLTNDIVLVGFQKHEYQLYKKVQRNIDSLSFDDAINKLDKLGVGFTAFYKNENNYQELEEWEDEFDYLITIENCEEEHE